MSYGRLAHEFPVAGSAYTYVRRVIDDRLGFLIWVWIVGFIALTTGLNIAGIQVAEKANWLLMGLQFSTLFLFVRLLYAMGRDGVLPDKIFGVLSPRFQTPV